MVWFQVLLVTSATAALVVNGLTQGHGASKTDLLQEEDQLDNESQQEQDYIDIGSLQYGFDEGNVLNNTGIQRDYIMDLTSDKVETKTKIGKRCLPTVSCTRAGGYCVKKGRNCNGTLDPYGCRGNKNCKCCIPDEASTVAPTCPDTPCPTCPAVTSTTCPVCPEVTCAPIPTCPLVTSTTCPVCPEVTCAPIPTCPVVTSTTCPVCPEVTCAPIPTCPLVTSTTCPICPEATCASNPTSSATTLPTSTTTDQLVVSCSSVTGGEVVDGQCLVFNTDRKISWSEARDACAAEGQVLAALRDLQGVKNYIASTFGATRNSYFWTGGSDAATEGRWLWLVGTPVGNIPWYGSYGGDCLTAGYDGYYDLSCTVTYYYICAVDTVRTRAAFDDSNKGIKRSRMTPKQCPDDFFNVNDQCFIIPDQGFATWEQAQELCKEQGGFLAEPSSITDFYDTISNMKTPYNLWIGSQQEDADGSWTWSSDKAKISHSKCGLLMRGVEQPLIARTCTEYHQFVCQKN